MSFSNTCLMDFIQTILVLLGHIYRNQRCVSPQSSLFEDIPPHFFSITRSYYILENCPHMNLSNICLMDFIQTILLLLGHNIGIKEVFHLDLHYLKISHPHFFSISRLYFILENGPHMSLSYTCLMNFIQTILVLIGHIYWIQRDVSPRYTSF